MNKEIKYLKKLRIKYAGNEDAYDAIMYHMLTTTAPPGMDIPQKLKRAVEFYTTPEGENAYAELHGEDKLPENQDIYDYSNDLAKAAQREGNTHFSKKIISPELLAAEALDRFSKTI